MSESLKTQETFEHETVRIEKEHRITSGDTLKASKEVRELSGSEARKDVAEATGESGDTQKIIEKLEKFEDRPQASSRSAVSREMKTTTLRRELKNFRRQESLPERTLSRVIHQPIVRAVSEGAAKTVTRPSGLLGGGLLAFLGSSSYFVLAKYIGFSYNYSVSLLLFVGGFVLGLALELLVHFMTSSRRQLD
jgi:hypothetical protein